MPCDIAAGQANIKNCREVPLLEILKTGVKYKLGKSSAQRNLFWLILTVAFVIDICFFLLFKIVARTVIVKRWKLLVILVFCLGCIGCVFVVYDRRLYVFTSNEILRYWIGWYRRALGIFARTNIMKCRVSITKLQVATLFLEPLKGVSADRRKLSWGPCCWSLTLAIPARKYWALVKNTPTYDSS